MTGLYVATPTYGGQIDITCHLATIQTVYLGIKRGWNFKFPSVSHESLITRARNYLLHDFMCSECDMIAWIDSDIGFNANELFRVVDAAKELKFVCGAYPKKGLDLEKFKEWAIANPDRPIEEFHDYAYNPLPGRDVEVVDRKDGGLYLPVRHAATGFMVWTRETAQRLINASAEHPYWSTQPNGNNQATFRVFHTDDNDHEYLSEDYWICEEWIKLGEKVYVDLNVHLTHSGRYTWKGHLASQFNSSDPTSAEEK